MNRHLQAPTPDPQQPDRNHDRALPVCELLTQVQVCAQLGISDQTWIRWRAARRTPEAVVMPSGRLKWRRVDIDALAGKSVEPSGRRYFASGSRHKRNSAAWPA
jgi:predicted DNA-binding transcriptional regulator AlpA